MFYFSNLLNRVGRVLPPTIPSSAISVSAKETLQAAAKLERYNVTAVRGAVPVEAFRRLGAFAKERFVDANNPGMSLPQAISDKVGEVYQTDLWLLRSILTPEVVAIASQYFHAVAGTRDFALPFANLLIRRFVTGASAPSHYVPFHQDGAALPTKFHMINAWTPLYPEEVGNSAPGLDIYPGILKHIDPIEEKPQSTEFKSIETNHRRFKNPLYTPFTPSLRRGDVLMFNQYCLHRTSTARCRLPRVSAEIRLVAYTNYVADEEARSGMAYARVNDGLVSWPEKWKLDNGRPIPISIASAPL